MILPFNNTKALPICAKNDYVIQVHADLSEIDIAAWNSLLDQQAQPSPFMQMQYLRALQESGSAIPRTGWTPQFITIKIGGDLLAACALYVKTHSYGEYVFDWAWADAYQRHGLRYYPKAVAALPFTPVPGTRLLARDASGRALLLQTIEEFAQQLQLSSVHLLFVDTLDGQAAKAAGWHLRQGIQFHWQQRADTPWTSFGDFLTSLTRDKRKKIQQEQRRVREAGVSYLILEGAAIQTAHWDFFYTCYCTTYQAHHSSPYLTREFFTLMQHSLPTNWLMVLAKRGEDMIGASLLGLDPQQRCAYGRYWGSIENVPCMHFDACYYQSLAWCIANGYQRFEGGAQGEHKMARGFTPMVTTSAHWLSHPDFARAVGDFVEQEALAIEQYQGELHARSPYKVDLG